MPDTCVQDYRHQQRGLDAKLNSPLQSAEKLFLLTSPFIEPSPQGRGKRIQNPALSLREREKNSNPCPLPRGEGAPRRALSPAGAGRVRGLLPGERTQVTP